MGDIFNFLEEKSRISATRAPSEVQVSGAVLDLLKRGPPPEPFVEAQPPAIMPEDLPNEIPPGVFSSIRERQRKQMEEAAKRKEEAAPDHKPVTTYSLFLQCWRTTFVIWKLFWKTVWGLK